MKKMIFLSLVLLAAFSLTFVTSCEKYEVSTPYEINDSITATLTGIVYADLDLSEAGFEFAPSGTKLFIKVALTQYNPNSPAGEFKTYTTTVGSNGRYTFKLPSHDKGVNYQIIPDEFEYDQIQGDGVETKRTIFSAAPFNGSAVASQTVINDIYY